MQGYSVVADDHFFNLVWRTRRSNKDTRHSIIKLPED